MEVIIGITIVKYVSGEEAVASSSTSCILQEWLPILNFNLQHWV